MRYTVDTIINKPIDKVTELFANPNNMKDWQPGFISMQKINGDGNAEGSVYRLMYKMGNRNIEMIETIEVNKLPANFTATFETKGVYNWQKSSFEKIDDHTTRYTAENLFKFSGFAKLYGVLMPKAFKKQSQKYLDLFKDFAESQ